MSNSAVLAAAPVSATRNPEEDVCVGPPIRPQRNNRSAGKGRRRRAIAEQRRAEQQHWNHLVHDSEEEIYVAPPRPPISRRQLRRAARRSSQGEWESNDDDDNLDVALALSLSLSETSHNASSEDSGPPVNSTRPAEQGHLDLSYESLVMLENVKCTAPTTLVSSLTGHIFNKDSHMSSAESVEELWVFISKCISCKNGAACLSGCHSYVCLLICNYLQRLAPKSKREEIKLLLPVYHFPCLLCLLKILWVNFLACFVCSSS